MDKIRALLICFILIFHVLYRAMQTVGDISNRDYRDCGDCGNCGALWCSISHLSLAALIDSQNLS